MTTSTPEHQVRRCDGQIVYKFVRAGSARITYPNKRRRLLTTGDVLAIGAGTNYEIAPGPGYCVTRVVFDRGYIIDQLFWLYTDLLPNRAAARRMLDSIYQVPIHDIHLAPYELDRVNAILDDLARALALPIALQHHARAMNLSWQLMTEITDLHTAIPPPGPFALVEKHAPSGKPRTRREARTVAELLTARPETEWSIVELAKRVHLSTSQLRRIFAAAYGMPPATYLARARAHRMATLLREQPPLSVQEAAAMVGWNSRTHATAAFTQHIGITPSTYRTQYTRPQ